MYQLAARMGTKVASGPSEDGGFHGVLYGVRAGRVLSGHSASASAVLLLAAHLQSLFGAPSPHPLHRPGPGQRQQGQGLRVQGRPRAVLAARPGESVGTVAARAGAPSEELTVSVFVLQERSHKAQMVVGAVKKKRGELVKGMERLCDAYISLAYMDASRHKAQKSERQLGGVASGISC